MFKIVISSKINTVWQNILNTNDSVTKTELLYLTLDLQVDTYSL